MKTGLLLFLCVILFDYSFPQIFTKITEGQLVNDHGDSRAVNWIDYDKDGDLDLYVTNGPRAGENNFFYINNGDGTFSKDSLIAIANDGRPSDGSSWGDYDNDGNIDLFVANWYNVNNLLYKNNGDRTFTLITNTDIYNDRGYSETGSWGDYNKDGFLDLYVCNSAGVLKNFLYKNNGDGTFTKVTQGAMVNDLSTSRNIDWIDFDNDGDDDIFVANENNENENLYRNNGDETFTKITSGSLVTGGGSSASSVWEDFDNDGDFDVYIANYGTINKNFYYTNNGDGTFTKITSDPSSSTNGNSFGTSTGDIDNDGDIDIYVTNAFTGTAQTNNLLFLNNGDGTFEKNSDDPSANDAGWSYGSALGDYDKDGYLDLFVAKCFNATENNSLFKNNGGTNNWIFFNLEGKISNRSAIGAIVKIKANVNGIDTWQMRRIAGQNGYCGQNLQVHFGLGNASKIDSLQIRWPSGIIENHGELDANQFLNITEDTTLTSVGSIDNEMPELYQLFQNYPNPFNPSTSISYSLKERGHVLLKIYDLSGSEVAVLVNEEQAAGSYQVKFNSESYNKNISSGVYFYSFAALGNLSVKKMIIEK